MPGSKLLPVCVCIGLLVASATNTVKVMSNEVGLRLCHGSWICVLILCSSMLWTRSLCLSALPSYRAPD